MPEKVAQFLVNLSIAAAEFDSATGQNFSELLSSLCSYRTFDFGDKDSSRRSDFPIDEEYEDSSRRSYFLINLHSYVKDYETKTDKSLLPALHSVYQSAPAVWSIDLSKRKASIFLEVLKLQTQKKPVELRGWSDEESEVRSFLQCLPYISQLRSVKCLIHSVHTVK